MTTDNTNDWALFDHMKRELYRSPDKSRVEEMRDEFLKHGLTLADMTIRRLRGQVGSKLR